MSSLPLNSHVLHTQRTNIMRSIIFLIKVIITLKCYWSFCAAAAVVLSGGFRLGRGEGACASYSFLLSLHPLLWLHVNCSILTVKSHKDFASGNRREISPPLRKMPGSTSMAVFPNLFLPVTQNRTQTLGRYPPPHSITHAIFFTEMSIYFGCTPNYQGTNDTTVYNNKF